MYENLNKEMANRKVKQSDIAKVLGKRNATVSDKLRGIYPFTLNEAKTIRNVFFQGYDIDYLFKVSDQ